jgi:hypothetical protein
MKEKGSRSRLPFSLFVPSGEQEMFTFRKLAPAAQVTCFHPPSWFLSLLLLPVAVCAARSGASNSAMWLISSIARHVRTWPE